MYGADIILLEILKNLDKSKYKPYVILPCNGPLVEELKKQNVEVNIVEYPILRRKYFNIRGLYLYSTEFLPKARSLVEFCREKNIQLVHSNTSAVLEGAYIWRKLNIKHIWHLHEMIEKPKIVYTALAKIISKNCDKVLTVSYSVKDHWLKSKQFKENQIVVIHNGIDLKRFNPECETEYLRREFNIGKDDKVVGVIGRINAIKGQEVFIKAMEKVFSNNKNVKALIIGGPFEGQEWRVERLIELINKSKFKDKFVLSDFRSDNANIQNLLDVAVLSSVAHDSFPTVVLEAMACKKPVVAFKCGGVVEMIENNKSGYIVEQGHIDELAINIARLLEDDKLSATMGNQGYLKVHERFSSSNFVLKVDELYSSLLKGDK